MRGESSARIRWFRQYVATTAALSLRRMRPWREAGAFGCDCSALVSMGSFMLVHVRSSCGFLTLTLTLILTLTLTVTLTLIWP